MLSERWKAIAGYEGFYEVSDHGRVKSLERVVARENASPMTVRERILSSPIDAIGRPHLRLFRGGKGSSRHVGRLVAEAFVQGQEPGMEACHNDGDPANNLWTNLRWDTPAANRLDSVRHGTHHWAQKTHCPRGHEYSPGNTQIVNGNQRRCRACDSNFKRAWRARKANQSDK